VAIQRGDGARVRQLQDASVEIVPHLLFARGELDLDLTLQILDVHEMLVAGAARLSVERGDENDLLHACELLRRMADPGLVDEPRAEVVEQVFALITRTSGNLVLRLVRNAIGPTLGNQLPRLMWGPLRPPVDVMGEGFEEIARAIEARDAVATEEAVRAMLRDRRDRLMRFLRENDSREPAMQHDTQRESHGDSQALKQQEL
jgi:DNA-binding FadR family transcriptional regulator